MGYQVSRSDDYNMFHINGYVENKSLFKTF